MRAVVLDYEDRHLKDREIPDPRIEAADQVLFRVAELGVCGTDREIALFHMGYPPPGQRYLTMGHEALGRVEQVGSSVTRVKPGDWVVPMIRRACDPPCTSCARGRRDLCMTGKYTERGLFGMHGYFSELALDRETDLVRVAPEVSRYAVLMEPMSTVEKAIESTLRLHPGGPESALVMGAGPVGILAALILRLRGLEVILHSLEPRTHPRVQLIENAGIEYREKLQDRSADLAIEATGSPDAPIAALSALRPMGVLMVLGAPNSRGELPFRDMIRKNQVIAGSVNASPQSFGMAAADLAQLPPAVLDTLIRRYRFEDYERTVLGPPETAPKLVHVVQELH